MWCAKCRADVAASYSPDGSSLRCASCGETLELVADAAREEARELLARWAEAESENREPNDASVSGSPSSPAGGAGSGRSEPPAATPLRPIPDGDETADPFQTPPPAEPAAPAPKSAKKWRLDARHDTPGSKRPDKPEPSETQARTRTYRVDAAEGVDNDGGEIPPRRPPHFRLEQPAPRRRIDAAHETLGSGPHFTPPRPAGRRSGASTAAKLLAYAGVVGMTAGAATLITSYFGGSPALAPTGWMAVTAGQMLLFLGVVSLISGGLEETSSEIGSRVEHLGDRMVRIESAAEELLRGPHFAAARSRETADVVGAEDESRLRQDGTHDVGA